MVAAELVRACLDKLALPQETELERPRVSAFAVLVGAVRGHELAADYKTRATRVSWLGAWGPGGALFPDQEERLGVGPKGLNPDPRPGEFRLRRRTAPAETAVSVGQSGSGRLKITTWPSFSL